MTPSLTTAGEADLLLARSAILSPCGTWRYRLERTVGAGIVAALLGVNPSKADAEVDDHTIRKLYGFGQVTNPHVGRWIVGNPFAFRATDVTELRRIEVSTAIGPENDKHLEQIMRDADLHIVAWGPLSKLPPHLRHRWRQVVAIADRVGCKLMCWGTAQDGHPRHPLMLAYNTPLIEWKRP